MLEPREVKSIEDAKKIVEERGLKYVKVAVFDNDGVMVGKYISKDKFFAALDGNYAMCSMVLGSDTSDNLYDNVTYTGWHKGYPDSDLRIIPESCRSIPMEGDMLLFNSEFVGEAADVSAQGMLKKVIQRAEDMGFDVYSAIEYEFFLFDETPESVRQKGYKNLKNFTHDNFTMSILRSTVHADLYQKILQMSEDMDFPLEGLHAETGPGVLEVALAVDKAEAMAEKAALFKTFMKVLAQTNGMMATFMAKWSEEVSGQSGHIHNSLRYKDGSGSAFYDASKPYNMSDTMKHFVAGQQLFLPEFTAMIAPTINSYSRLVPGFWAPTEATWGVENRTTALRVIPGSDKSQRVEFRIGSADSNPYLSLAAAIGAGLYGIEHKLEPGEMTTGNAYEKEQPDSLKLPGSLWDAAQRLKSSEAANELFGSAFVEHFAASREWEEREFRRHVTDWELQRYFEII